MYPYYETRIQIQGISDMYFIHSFITLHCYYFSISPCKKALLILLIHEVMEESLKK